MDGGTPPIRLTKGTERSFAEEGKKLLLGQNEVFHGETILAVTKALLQSGVAYVGGYPGAPMSHLMDVLADSSAEILEPLGIQFEQSASEAGAAALLGASIHYPLRGAVTWKSVVGTNVASDALSNVASAGVTGGALIIIGEDYGEGASVIQERTYAFAMKSSLPLLDPRYDVAKIVDTTQMAFELSEVSHLPVMMELRIRACHMTGSFVARDNVAPKYSLNTPLPAAIYDPTKIVLPPHIYNHEKAKFDERLPAAQKFIHDNGVNEIFPGAGGKIGIITQGGTYTVLMRALRLLGAADAFGKTDLPVMVLNAIYPLVTAEIEDFIRDKDTVLVIEEGHPNYVENQIAAIAQRARIQTRIHGKDCLPMAGEYTADTVRAGVGKYLSEELDGEIGDIVIKSIAETAEKIETAQEALRRSLPEAMPPRPPSFCVGCPERPVFAALKMLMRERGQMHVSMDIGCNTFATLPPFNVGSTVLGYGMSLASGGVVGPALGHPTIAVMGDGGFWHNGLSTGAINAHWNKYDAVLIVVDNHYAAATGQHHVPSTGSTPKGAPSVLSIEKTLRGIGVDWIERVDSYDLPQTYRTIRKALDARGNRLRVVLSDNECMLARQRRERPVKAAAKQAGKPVLEERFGVDAEVCTGDHSCMRLSGCPSLTLKDSGDPLKETPVAHVDENCVACGHCGEVAHAAQLCPSFYKAQGKVNPGPFRRFAERINRSLMDALGAS
jgi:indolepyruvate ferredoxin oxidoreductase alpha subunit